MNKEELLNLKYDLLKKSDDEIVKKTVYQEVHDNNINYPKDIALEFFKSKINFSQLDNNVELAAKALREYGVKKGDFVTIVSAGIPETVYAFYGISKIGAVANMMGYYFDGKGLVERLDDCQSDLLLVMDEFYPLIKPAINKSRIKNVVIIPTLNSSILNVFSKKYKLEKSNELFWNQFIKDGDYQGKISPVQYEKEMPLAMVYSSGTTGASKGILLSNDSFQNSLADYRKSDIKIGRGYKFYQIIPPWYSTGLSTSINLPLSSGSTVFMDPRFKREIFVKNIIKSKPNYSVAPTSMYEGFLDESLVKNCDLSSLIYPFEGGEPLSNEVKEKIESVFKQHNNSSNLLVGYGQCECGATITTETPSEHKNGSVGKPLPGIDVLIVDDKHEELPNNTRGEILVNTNCGMLEYYKNEDATKDFFYARNNSKYACTGDLGYKDEDGFFFVEGRMSDYSIINGKKVYNFDIEKSIMKDENIKMCDVITNDDLLTAHVIFSDDFIKNNDQNSISEELKYLQSVIYEDVHDADLVPYCFKIRSSFPSAKSGKRDVKSMKEEKDGFIHLEKYRSNCKKLVRF